MFDYELLMNQNNDLSFAFFIVQQFNVFNNFQYRHCITNFERFITIIYALPSKFRSNNFVKRFFFKSKALATFFVCTVEFKTRFKHGTPRT